MLKIIFAGTHEIAVPTLNALIKHHQIIAVYTQPDRPAGRGQQLTASPVKALALKQNLAVYQPETLRDEKEQERIKSLNADVMVVMGYGLLLPKAVLQAPRYGCINPHISLLPRWRGAAPVQHAILAGDHETGVTIIQMDEGLDTGPMLNQQSCKILDTDTSSTLHERLAQMAAPLLLSTLENLETGNIHAISQDNSQATYASKIEKAAAKIDWQKSAIMIDRMIRAFNPWPVAFTYYQKNIIRLWRAQPLLQQEQSSPGTILKIHKEGIDVATSEGVLRILELQLSGGKRLSIADFLNARKDFFVTKKFFEND